MKQKLYVLRNIKQYVYPIRWSVTVLVILSLLSLRNARAARCRVAAAWSSRS